MILITGAAGKTGKAILRKLADKGKPVRALVFHSAQIPEIEVRGAQEVVVGDMRDENVIIKAMQDVESVYHICPNMHPDEITIGQLVIDIACASEIAHFVYHSVLHPQIEAMPHHWNKMRVEERLFESGLPYTILQPAVYMQNVTAAWDNILKTGRYAVPYAVESRISMVDLEDVAEVASLVLSEVSKNGNRSYHLGATYELIGTHAMSQIEVASILSEQLGKPVLVERIPREVWERDAKLSGLSDYKVATLLKMFDYYDVYGFGGSPAVLSWLLDRTPTNFDDVVRRTIAQQMSIPM